MRLIDADMLKTIISNTYYKPHEVIGIINSRPTVEAIPIKWIEEYRQNRVDYADEYNAKAVLKRLLETWEKENEKTDEKHS